MNKLYFKIFINFGMIISLMLLTPYELVGQTLHEWIGLIMAVLFITHSILNFRWFKMIFKVKYTHVRIFQMILIVLILISILGSMISGIILSRHIFVFMNISLGKSLARIIHMLCTYWGLILMSMHLGSHFSTLGEMLKKISLTMPKKALRILGILISLYGIYAFICRELFSYMKLQVQFVFFDFEEPLIFL